MTSPVGSSASDSPPNRSLTMMHNGEKSPDGVSGSAGKVKMKLVKLISLGWLEAAHVVNVTFKSAKILLNQKSCRSTI